MNTDQQPNANTPPEGSQNPPVPEVPTVETPVAEVASSPEPAIVAVASPPATPAFGQSRKSKKLPIIIAAAALVVLLGGGAAAYKFWYQNPAKVLSDGITNLISETQPVAASGVITAKAEGMNIKLTLAGDSHKNVGNAKANVEIEPQDGPLKGKKITLKAEALSVSEGDAYFKVSNLKESVTEFVNVYIDNMVQEYKDMGYELSAADIASMRQSMSKEIDPIVTKIDNQWIKISAKDLNKDSESDKSVKCYQDAIAKLQDSGTRKEFADAYSKNQFVTVKKELGEKDGSQGYELEYNSKKVDAFQDQLKTTSFGKSIEACNTADGKSTEDAKTTDEDAPKIKTFQVWVSTWSHKITQVVYEGSSADDASSGKIDVTLSYGKPVTATAPKDAKSIDEISESLNNILGVPTSGTV